MDRRTLLLALAGLSLAAALPAAAQGVDVSAINSYLLGMRAARGRFRQTNPNGSTQAGSGGGGPPGEVPVSGRRCPGRRC
jgi:hypothetical protein